MISKLEDTIIIGAGISGLACARKLRDNNKPFLIISEDIGGRILMSGDGNVAYGAYFVGDDYVNVSDYIERKHRINIFEFRPNNKGNIFFFWKHFFKYFIQIIKLLFILLKFKRHYFQMKKMCADVSQKKAIEEDEYLRGLYNERAIDFIKEKGIFDIYDRYIEKLLYGILFSGAEELNAFEFLRWSLYLTIPIYEFRFLRDKIIKGFEDNIIIDSIVSIDRQSNYFILSNKNKEQYRAKNIVIATPINISQELIDIKDIKEPALAYMFHLKADTRNEFKGLRYFTSYRKDGVFGVALQSDGTYLFYCNHPSPKFDKYFSKYEIIAEKFWNPAFNIRGSQLLECEQGENLYLIGDHNIAGLEDSFITGLYAANRIIKEYSR